MRASLCWIAALVIAFAAAASAQPSAVVAPDVAARTARGERVRVMIAFDVGDVGGPAASGPARAVGIAAKRAEILAGIPAADFEVLRDFGHVPAVAGLISAAGLDGIARRPGVRRIDIDAPGGGNLNQARTISTIDPIHALGFTGVGITVAVLDSGYDSDHPDLAADLVAEACFCSGGGGCCPGGGSSETGLGSAEDDHGHGTNVSGIVTSDGTGSPAGAAPDAGVVAIKVLDDNNSFCCSSDVIAGLDWIISDRPDVDVVNMSLGTFALFTGDCDAATSFTIAFAAAIDTLRGNGVPVFVSTGNNGSGTQMQAPACVANSLSVGAVWDSNFGSITILGCTETSPAPDLVTCFSNSNAQTDLFAPGAAITSTGINGGNSVFFGTSQASPLVAGCAALLLDKDPTLTPDEIEDFLEASPTLVTDVTNGLSFPRVDCSHALSFVKPIPALPVWAFGAGAAALLAAARRAVTRLRLRG